MKSFGKEIREKDEGDVKTRFRNAQLWHERSVNCKQQYLFYLDSLQFNRSAKHENTPGGPVCRQVKRCRFHLDQFSRVEEPNQRMSCNNRRYTRNPQISRQGRWRSLSRKRSFSLLKHRHRRFSFLRVSGAYLPRGLFLYTYTCLSFHLSLFLLFPFVFRFHVVFFPFNFCSFLSLSSVLFYI